MVKYVLHSSYTLWLFTFSDLKTIVAPMSAFGVITSLSGSIFATGQSPDAIRIFQRIPWIVFWVWINLLPFAIDNQRRSSSIEEDKINKPWRPLPSSRCTRREAKSAMIVLYAVAILTSVYLGGLTQCMILILLGWIYNELGGSDENFVIRNMINAAGFVAYGSGAMAIALGPTGFSLSEGGYRWFQIVGAVVLTTVQMQDMLDQAGDKARSRKTIPLVIGDQPARWTVAIPTLFWSFFCPSFWRLHAIGYIAPAVVGGLIVFRVFSAKSVHGDKVTFRIWNFWMVVLYFLPLMKKLS